MALGPGKYDELCTTAREAARAEGLILIVVGGIHGNGFCVQGTMKLQMALPKMLRHVADQIEADVNSFKKD